MRVYRAAERICGPKVKTKHGPLAKRVVKGTLKAHQLRGSKGACSPRKIVKIKIIRIALVTICAFKYNYHIIELDSHYVQESRYNSKLLLLNF